MYKYAITFSKLHKTKSIIHDMLWPTSSWYEEPTTIIPIHPSLQYLQDILSNISLRRPPQLLLSPPSPPLLHTLHPFSLALLLPLSPPSLTPFSFPPSPPSTLSMYLPPPSLFPSPSLHTPVIYFQLFPSFPSLYPPLLHQEIQCMLDGVQILES